MKRRREKGLRGPKWHGFHEAYILNSEEEDGQKGENKVEPHYSTCQRNNQNNAIKNLILNLKLFYFY